MKSKQFLHFCIFLVCIIFISGCRSSVADNLDDFPFSLIDAYFYQQASSGSDVGIDRDRVVCFGLWYFPGFGIASKETQDGIYVLLRSGPSASEMHICSVVNSKILKRSYRRIDMEVFERFNALIDQLRIQSYRRTVSQFFIQGENAGGLYLSGMSNDEVLRVLNLLRDFLPDESVVDLLLDRLHNKLEKDSQCD